MIILKLIKNEIIKILARKKSLVTSVAFILLVTVLGFAMYKESANAKRYNSPAFQIEQEKSRIEYLKNSNEPNAQQELKQAETRISELEKVQSGEKQLDWKSELKQQNENMKADKNEQTQLQIKMNEYLINNNILPEQYDYNATATKFLKLLFEVLGVIFLVVGVLIFGADMVSGEFTPPTMKFLLAQPVSRGKILFSKFAALFITSAGLILSIELIGFIVMGLLFGFGNMNYPVFVGSRFVFDPSQTANMGQKAMIMAAGSTYIIPMSQYIIRMFLMQLLFILAAVSFTFLISTIIRSSMVSMAIGTVAVISSTVLQQIPYTKKVVQYLFTTYGRFEIVFNGSASTYFNNPNITVSFVIGVFTAWIIICYVISHIYFVKRDILI